MHLALAEAIVREKKSKKNEIENPIPKAIQIKSNTRESIVVAWRFVALPNVHDV